MDIVGGLRLVSPVTGELREAKVVTAVDDHSRYCVIAKVAERAASRRCAWPWLRRWCGSGCRRRSSLTFKLFDVSGCVARCPAGSVWRPGDRRLPAVVAD
jgi:hypothetical protein